MRKGMGSAKGSAFERLVCKRLSLWVSRGRHSDLFWRTSASGARATQARKRGVVVRQAGDVCAVAPHGHIFTDMWYIECKHYRRVGLDHFIFYGKGKLRGWWDVCKRSARDQGKEPMLIVKQNFGPIIVITRQGQLARWIGPRCNLPTQRCDVSLFDDLLAVEFVQRRKQ